MTKKMHMKWSNCISKLMAAICIGTFMGMTHASDCEELRSYFKKASANDPDITSNLAALQTLMNADDLCAKNLFGQLEFEGKHIPQSTNNSKNIFSDLSNKNYPPAMFNLAFVLSKDKKVDPEVVTTILLGIYATYVNDTKYTRLAHKSADYGRHYIESLEEPEKTNSKKKFEAALSDINVDIANQTYEKVRRSNEIVESFGNVLLAGAAIYVGARIGSAAVSSARSTTYIQNNVMNYSPSPSLYQIYPSSGGLYAIPLR